MIWRRRISARAREILGIGAPNYRQGSSVERITVHLRSLFSEVSRPIVVRAEVLDQLQSEGHERTRNRLRTQPKGPRLAHAGHRKHDSRCPLEACWIGEHATV